MFYVNLKPNINKNFEFYQCNYDKIIIAVNMLHLFKLINSIDNDDTLTIYIEKDDYNDGVVSELGLKFENGDIKQSKIQKLKLIEPEQDELEIPDVEFSSVINMPSNDFQKIIRDLANISEKIEIKSLASGGILKSEVLSVSVLGTDETLTWNRTSTALEIPLPKELPNQPVIGLKISLK